ncbi:PIN domain nuclease [Symbioplanes lichenis]|uniref:PIN domain nuclease n=1 Tax=Symbioplanes lichenis TaxID=1629072 RepID=UPI0027398762|nr:PIN domain nuclease [Actinoplanes lichenis]
MSKPTYLVDTSAYARLIRDQAKANEWDEDLTNGRVGICSFTELEIFVSVRSLEHRQAVERVLHERFPWVPVPDRAMQRAQEVQFALTKLGQHRSAGPVDLLVAATAELGGRTLLHYDRDFATVAEVTGQPVQWIAEPGTVD